VPFLLQGVHPPKISEISKTAVISAVEVKGIVIKLRELNITD
jgi:hypothetical protein